MDVPRLAQKGEFVEIMNFIDLVFRPGQAGRLIMQRQYPHLFQNKAQYWQRITTLRDGGELVGCLGIHPVDLRFEEVQLRAGGIGQVATHPQRRGEGIMGTMLNDAIARMYKAGYSISILGGDRQRYGWFGWENGGVRQVYQVTPRSLGKAAAIERRLPLKRLDTSAATMGKLHQCTLHHPYWALRPKREIVPLFKRNGREVWICQAGRRFAYVVLNNRTGLGVDEMGGDADLAVSILRVLMGRRRWQNISVVTGPNTDQIDLIRPFAAGWNRQCDGMIKIINLPLLLEQLTPLLKRRAKAAGIGGRYRFAMEESGQSGLLELGKGKTNNISLNARDMVSFFFGIDPLTEVFGQMNLVDKLSHLLPLPLFVPPLNHV